MDSELYQHLREILPYAGFGVFCLIFVVWCCWFFRLQKDRLDRMEIDDES